MAEEAQMEQTKDYLRTMRNYRMMNFLPMIQRIKEKQATERTAAASSAEESTALRLSSI